jgi:hypothetical protein
MTTRIGTRWPKLSPAARDGVVSILRVADVTLGGEVIGFALFSRAHRSFKGGLLCGSGKSG